MKLAEEAFLEDGRLIVKETHDFNPVLDRAAKLRSHGMENYGESKLAAVIPMAMWADWARKWGVKPDDTEAMKDVVARELMNPDNAHFRVWGGRF